MTASGRPPAAFMSSFQGLSSLQKTNFATVQKTPLVRGRRAAFVTPKAQVQTDVKKYDVEIKLYGQDYVIPVYEDQTFLEGIEEFGLEVPYSCRAGVCITCAAKVIAGDIDLGEAAITDDLKGDGYVLTCSGFPRSDGIKLELNHFEDAYDKQYGQYEAE